MIDTRADGRPIVSVTTPQELSEALDALHTQVIDNFPEEIAAPYEALLAVAMESCDGSER